MNKIIKLKKRKKSFGHDPATEKDVELIEKMIEDISQIWGKCPGIYIGGYGGFCLDTTEDIPEKVRNVLKKYNPKII